VANEYEDLVQWWEVKKANLFLLLLLLFFLFVCQN